MSDKEQRKTEQEEWEGKEDEETRELVKEVIFEDSEKDALRSELLDFLEEFRGKKNDEGRPLIQFPNNFDEICDAMSRKDLESSHEESWSRFLLEAQFDKDSKRDFEGGRYSKVISDTEDMDMVNRGLAEIHLYDEKIRKLNAQSRQLGAKAVSESQDNSHKLGRTFLTGTGSGLDSARSENSEYSTHEQQTKHFSTSESIDATVQESKDTKHAEGSSSPSKKILSISDQCDFGDKELRLEAILNASDDEDSEVWDSISRYGYSEESRARINEIDRQIAELHPLPQNKNEFTSSNIQLLIDENVCRDITQVASENFPPLPSPNENESSTGNCAAPKEDVLRQQRIERQMKGYENKLNKLLEALHAEELNISGLVNSPRRSSNSSLPPIPQAASSNALNGSKKKKKKSNAESAIASRVVTMDEVLDVINELRDLHCEDSSIPLTAEQKIKMKKLLSSIESDASRLRSLRGQDSTFLNEGTDVSISSNYTSLLDKYKEDYVNDVYKNEEYEAKSSENQGDDSQTREYTPLTRLTTHELKELSHREIPASSEEDDAEVRLHVEDILAKRGNVKRNQPDGAEMLINLEHAKEKVACILNRVNLLSGDEEAME